MVKDLLEKYAIQCWIGSLILTFLGVIFNILILIIFGIIFGIIIVIQNQKKFRILSHEYLTRGLLSILLGILIFLLLRKENFFIAKLLLTSGILIGLGLSPLWFYSLWFLFLIALSSFLASFVTIPNQEHNIVWEKRLDSEEYEYLQDNIIQQQIKELLYPDAVEETERHGLNFNVDSATFVTRLLSNQKKLNTIELDFDVEYDKTNEIIQQIIDIYVTDELETQAIEFIAWIKAFTNSIIQQVTNPEKFGEMLPELILGALLGKIIEDKKKKKDSENTYLRKFESDLKEYKLSLDIDIQTQVEIHNETNIINIDTETIENFSEYFEKLIEKLKED